MRHLFIINPHAGKYDRSQEMLEKVRFAMEGRREEWTAVRTTGPGHAMALVQEAARQGDPMRIYACGGDGTLNEVVNGAAGQPQLAVTHCPIGSGNDFLRIFGEDAGRFWHLDQLLDGPQTAMDLIECSGRYALNVCSVGFDARIGLGAADFKKLPLVSGSVAYQLSAIRTIIQGIHLPYRLEIDGERLPGNRFTLMCACNGRYYGGGFNPCPDAMPDDGVLDFVVIPAVSRFTVLALIQKFARGEIGEISQVMVRRGRTMKVWCDRVTAVNVDGERVDGQELTIGLSDKKVQFFYPAGASWRRTRHGGSCKHEAAMIK